MPLFIFMLMYVQVSVNVCHVYEHAHTGQKRAISSAELELHGCELPAMGAEN